MEVHVVLTVAYERQECEQDTCMMKPSWRAALVPFWRLPTLGARSATASQHMRGVCPRQVHASAFVRKEKPGSEGFNFDDIFVRNKTWVNNQRGDLKSMHGICFGVNAHAEACCNFSRAICVMICMYYAKNKACVCGHRNNKLSHMYICPYRYA